MPPEHRDLIAESAKESGGHQRLESPAREQVKVSPDTRACTETRRRFDGGCHALDAGAEALRRLGVREESNDYVGLW